MKQEDKFYLAIDYKSPIPVYEQIKRSIIILITTQDLLKGEKLLPIRELAKVLRVNHNTIVKVYYQLELEKYLYSKPGTGYFVSGLRPFSKQKQKEIFNKLTEEYIHQSFKLGFDLKDIVKGIKAYKNE
jgi:GntR family transcriptional regulator